MKRVLIFIITAFIVCNSASADEWPISHIKKFYSNNCEYLLEITPSIKPDRYWEWKRASIEEKKYYSEIDTIIIPCYATLYKLYESGKSQIRKIPLLNEDSPVSAIVADNGGTFVTFDEWGGVGYGENVMVVYNFAVAERRYSLREISPFSITSYYTTVSLIYWFRERKYIEDNLIEICFEDEDENQITRVYNVRSHKLYDKTDSGMKEVEIKYDIMDMIKNQSKEPKVTGIGGIFFKSEDPAKMRQWYATNLGLEVNEYGSTFETRNANNPNETNYLQWSPFTSKTDYFEPSQKDFMINYRVQEIEALVAKLKANGVTILDDIEQYEYGKFVHILDAEGNKIELWEPIDSKTTK
jgi:predicted enzyme related to lactoylglutathione lyase